MFLVLNKEKINTYFISIITVVFLFLIASAMQSPKVIETSVIPSKLVPIYNVDTLENKVAFTMNCAWGSEDIDTILEILEENNVKITFFMVGDWIDENEEAARKIYEAGHEIATHSNTHPHVNDLSYEENLEELEKSNIKIEEITGKKTKIYRAPYGEYNDTVIKSATENGYKVIQWSLDTLDYTALTGDQMWARLNGKLKSGDIILSHNGTNHTADSLDMLIKNIKEEGFEIVTVSKLIYHENYDIDSNGTQYLKGI